MEIQDGFSGQNNRYIHTYVYMKSDHREKEILTPCVFSSLSEMQPDLTPESGNH